MRSIIERLPKASNQDLLYLCSQHKVPGAAMTRQQMIEALIARFSDPDYIYQSIKALPKPARMTLQAYSMTSNWWSAQARLLKLLGEPHDQHLLQLKQLGYMEGAYSVVPEAATAAVRVWLEEVIQGTKRATQMFPPDPMGPGLMRDIFAVAGMAWRRQLPITKDGRIFKKAEDELMRRMEGSPIIEGDTMKLFVVSYMLDRGLLAQAAYDDKGKGGFVATDRVWAWADMTWGEIWADMADYLISVRSHWTPIVPLLIQVMSTLKEEEWLPHGRLVAAYQAMDGDGAAALDGFLFLMGGFGLLDVGTNAKDEDVLRPSQALRSLLRGEAPKLAAPEPKFILDPTFSITAPKTITPAVLARLERWCTERKADMVLTYKLSQASLRVALEEGDKPADVIGFFDQHTYADLPQNVLFSLREWTAGAKKARFEEVVLLRVGDADTAQLIIADKTARKWIHGQVTPTDLIIDKAGVEKVRKRLGEIGVTAAPGVGRPGKSDGGSRVVQVPEHAEDAVSPKLFRAKWMGK